MKTVLLIYLLALALAVDAKNGDDDVKVAVAALPAIGGGDPLSADTFLAKADTLLAKSDSVRRLSRVRQTIRGFDELHDDYIEPDHYNFSVMIQASQSFESFTIGSNGQSVLLAPDRTVKVGPYFGWRWLFPGYTFDLKNISFTSDGVTREFNFSIYSSQVGVDLFYRRTGSDYKLRDVRLGYGIDGSQLEGEPFDGVSVGMTGVNAYYIFNHGRFSYPAAFSQSTCQKVSCGSWMAGAGYFRNTLNLDFEALKSLVESRLSSTQQVRLDSGMMFDRIAYSDFSISGGYAYNWVPGKNWLLTASGQAALSYKTSYGDTPNEPNGFNVKKVNLDFIGRFAVVYNCNTRWFAALCLVMRSNNYHTSRFTANNVFGSFSANIGYNFGLRKKYRKS